jgi:hypothetical protein
MIMIILVLYEAGRWLPVFLKKHTDSIFRVEARRWRQYVPP